MLHESKWIRALVPGGKMPALHVRRDARRYKAGAVSGMGPRPWAHLNFLQG